MTAVLMTVVGGTMVLALAVDLGALLAWARGPFEK
jgi:hypothetical protein